MTPKQISLVTSSWKIFKSIDPVLVGDVFYSKLFIMAPGLKHLFHSDPAEQSKKIVEMLSVIVGRLDRLDELTAEIRHLALRHVSYGVEPEHYKMVGTALLWMLEQGLGKDWNEEVKEAWTACYSTLSATMIASVSQTTKGN